jgi:uncharacterized protein
MITEILIVLLLMIVAFLYASVGHGGASGYIAVLTLFNISLSVYKPVVLVLNIIIAGIAFIQFFRAGYFKWNLCWPFLITSVPFAFWGSHFASDNHLYKILLGLALLFPIIRLVSSKPKEKIEQKKINFIAALCIGAVIGFVSGFLNIGGGIFLSPVLILLAWSNLKEAAAVSSLFIVCNSLAGLLAATTKDINFTTSSYVWICAAIIGGLIGSYMGSHQFKQLTIRYLLSVVLSIAGIKLIFFS